MWALAPTCVFPRLAQSGSALDRRRGIAPHSATICVPSRLSNTISQRKSTQRIRAKQVGSCAVRTISPGCGYWPCRARRQSSHGWRRGSTRRCAAHEGNVGFRSSSRRRFFSGVCGHEKEKHLFTAPAAQSCPSSGSCASARLDPRSSRHPSSHAPAAARHPAPAAPPATAKTAACP